jgi:hypothetical protein
MQAFSENAPAAPPRGPRTRLRGGVIGLGRQALDDHVPGLLASDRAVLAAVCDENKDVLREQEYQHRVPGYTDFPTHTVPACAAARPGPSAPPPRSA